MRTYLHTRIPAYLHFCILHTCIPTYLHPYIPTYVHTYIPRSPLFASCCCIDWELKKQTAFMLKKPQHSFLPFVFPAFLSSRLQVPYSVVIITTNPSCHKMKSWFLSRYGTVSYSWARNITIESCRASHCRPKNNTCIGSMYLLLNYQTVCG